ncbi:MAG: HpcH/HpaI aldolase/citrate lyase family protein [Armatimonadetes bacterium]|nr:HpcH/HpaI aldolase/citrate lyase family protein [Armatimonadota bacterium]
MISIRNRVLNGELLSGTWLNLGSSLTAEMAGGAGFDWVLIDLEHGVGDYACLLHQLQAVGNTQAAPVVRIPWNDPVQFKRVLDLGPCGVMVPYVNTADEARQAASSMRYPPQGIRGVAKLNRACGFGQDFDDYFDSVNDNLLTVVQIETETALGNVEEIAAVEGIDVLFVGPMDLSVSLEIPQQFDHPRFRSALTKIAEACSRHGKAAGILLGASEQIEQTVADGYTFVALNSDGGLVASGMRKLAAEFERYRQG